MEDLSESNSCLFPPNKVNMVVINNLMNSACESAEIEKAFTVHHRHFSILCSVQKGFHRVRKSHYDSLHNIYGVI